MSRTTVRWGVRAATLALLLAAAWYPFDLDPMIVRTNDLEVLADGTLRFSGSGFAWTGGPPAWLDEAIRGGRFEVVLEARTASPAQAGPARLLTVSEDQYFRNLTVGQEGADLVVRFRRPGADANGTPPFVVPDVFTGDAWHRIEVAFDAGELAVRVDGEGRLMESLGPGALERWDPTYRLALGNELTVDRPWAGELRLATASAGGVTVDYLDPANIEAPERYWRTERVRQFLLSQQQGGLVAAGVHLVAYGAAGVVFALTARRRPGGAHVALIALALAAVTEFTQALFAERHATLIDLGLDTLGALAGGLAGIAAWRAVPALRRHEVGEGDGP